MEEKTNNTKKRKKAQTKSYIKPERTNRRKEIGRTNSCSDMREIKVGLAQNDRRGCMFVLK